MLELVAQRFKDASEWRRWRVLFIRVCVAAFALHLIAAWFSSGFLSADEHFQILEFISFKQGRLSAASLPIEYPERMRSWLLPWIGWILIEIDRALGITSPLVWAWTFRLLSSLIGWFSLVAIASVSPLWLSDGRARRAALWISGFLCFLPALHARPSSENWGGSMFALAIALLATSGLGPARCKTRASVSRTAIIGMLLGAAFEFRFQMGVAIAGLGAWLLFRRKLSLSRWVALAAGFAVVFALGRLADRWGYGGWALPPWNYFRFNILQGHVSDFRRSAWWDFFRMSLTEAWPPAGLVLFLGCLAAWILTPLDVLSFSFVPFVLVHFAIAHKELRFLYPVVHCAPLLLAIALDRSFVISRAVFFKPLRYFLVFDNLVGLALLVFLPASRMIAFYAAVETILAENRHAPMRIFTFDRDPYVHVGLRMSFYQPAEVTVSRRSVQEIEALLAQEPIWLFDDRPALPSPTLVSKCQTVYQSFPSWIVSHVHLPENVRVWKLYSCK